MSHSSTQSLWPAPLASAPLAATITVPGSKSLTNRALPLAALADEPTTVRGALRSRDTDLMIAALRALGTGIESDGGTLHITPRPVVGGTAVDCGLAGTVMRFLPPIAALADAPVSFDGDPAARQRPMGPVVAALQQLGVRVRAGGPEQPVSETPGGLDHLPLTVHGSPDLAGGRVEVDASGSSQFISALLLVAPRLREGLTVQHTGSVLPSRPHIEMTMAMLRDRGVRATEQGPATWQVEPGPISGGEVFIEPDLSNAAPFLAAALAAGGTVRLPHWPEASTQPGMLLPELLRAFGAEVDLENHTLRVTGPATPVPVDLDLSPAGELAPTMAALAALAPGTSRLRGIAHLRGHETNRLAALVTEITNLGGSARELDDGLEIHGGGLHGAQVQTYADHRMATFAAVIGLAVPGVEIVDVETTAKTIPDFPGLWGHLIGESSR